MGKTAALICLFNVLAISLGQDVYFPPSEESVLDFVNRAGVDDIVTPEPLSFEPSVPTLSPVSLITANGDRCTCVPYFMCKPENDATDQNKFGEIDVNFNPETCQDVLDVCCRAEDSLVVPLNTTLERLPTEPTGCGLRNIGGIDFTLTGNFNNEAGFGEFPWTVALMRNSDGTFVCGGSLIHPSLVLTGAHCAAKAKQNELRIRAGEWDTQTTKERLPFQERLVSKANIHPEFNPRSLAFDVAVLVLDKPVVLSDHINVVCLPPANFVTTSSDCFASGWGKNLFGKAGKYSVIMKKVPLPLVDNGSCERQLQTTRLTSRFRLHPTFICAGGQEGIDTCEGDGGSPLVCPIGRANENRYAQIGSVAWGIGCHQKLPAVYASIPRFRPWIDNVVRTLGYDPSTYDSAFYQ